MFTFFDFCSGIGAGHAALANIGGRCVGISEIDEKAEITYRKIHQANYKSLKNWGDLTKILPEELPDFDLMIAGFPCQTFSIVGKRGGMKESRGQIIYYLADILKAKRVRYFLLENVKGLVNHNKGHTLNSILKLLDESGYNVNWEVLKSTDFGLPQKRERIYLVGTRKDLNKENFIFPSTQEANYNIKDFLMSTEEEYILDENDLKKWNTFNRYLNNKYNKGDYKLDDLLKEEFLVIDTRQSDLRLYKNECPTLRTGRHGILYVKNKKLRQLSGLEYLLLQGFKMQMASRAIGISDSDLKSQAGNAFSVNVIEAIASNMISQFNFGIREPRKLKLENEIKVTPKDYAIK